MILETDVLVVGSGPAGIQAAIYASRRKLNVIVLGKMRQSSLYHAKIENLSCIDGIISGDKLLDCSKKKAELSGVIFSEKDALEVQRTESFIVKTESGKKIKSISLIIATGVRRDRLNVKGEEEYVGKGVAYCADCDAPFFKDKKVAAVGCGSSAGYATLLVKGYTDDVYFICKSLDIDKNLRNRIENAKVKILEGASIAEIRGDASVNAVVLKN